MNQQIFPIFNENLATNKVHIVQKNHPIKKEQKTRWDKCHAMKFPVTQDEEQVLRRLYKRHKQKFQATSITTFTSMLLRYGLRNPYLVKDCEYKDTGTYKTVKPNQIEYNMIGGENGFAIIWNVSERKALHRILISVLRHLEREGDLGYAEVQPLRPVR